MTGAPAKAPAWHIVPAGSLDAQAMARLHGQSFPQGWDAAAFGAFLENPACLSLTAREAEGDDMLGFVTARSAGPEAEIITLAVAPGVRCRGIGRGLIGALAQAVAARGAVEIFLEVGEDNHAAAALYRRAGFAEAGRREGYYARRGGAAARDALVLRLALPPA